MQGLQESIRADHENLSRRWQEELACVEKLLCVRTEIEVQLSQGKKTKKLQQTRERLQKKLTLLRASDPLVFYEVDPDMIAGVIAAWTHIPLGKLLRDEAENLLHLQAQFASRIKGQSPGLALIAEHIQLSKAGLKNPKQPLGVFLLVGPSGVGKTETALTLADTMFGGEESLITVNMSEFQEKHTVSRLIGSPPGYVGYGEGGMLTEAVRKRPYSVVLLDEVEKAHPDVLNLFYQVFDKGSLTDGEGREVDFSNSLIFLTSNLASDEIIALSREDASFEAIVAHIRPILSAWFKPALLARMTVIPYLALREAHLLEIVLQKLKKVEERLYQQYQIELEWDETLSSWLIQHCQDKEAGARNVDFMISQKVLPCLSLYVLEHFFDRKFAPKIRVELDGSREEIVLNCCA